MKTLATIGTLAIVMFALLGAIAAVSLSAWTLIVTIPCLAHLGHSVGEILGYVWTGRIETN